MPDIEQPDPNGETDERLRVRTALSAVPARQRAVLILRFYLGMTAEEAADVLGVRAATVRSQTSRGLANLKAALAAGGLVLDATSELGEWNHAHQRRGGPGDIRATTAALHR